ncbi:energy transducer TonB [Sphingomonas nostoxanthinifaciens]|nr:energy transducer TonB [Sphingomonas nostoxanthinifaciens]
MAGIAFVVLFHALIGYAFITGLAFNVIKKAAQDLKVVDVQDQPPPPEQKPPPPPPDQKVEPPPVVAPPPIVQTPAISAPAIVSVPTPPPAPVITPAAPPAPPPPPPPVVSKAAGAKGDPAQWITNDDYPPAALRENREGVTKISWQINEQGKVENCQVTESSGSPDLDETACRLITRRGKYSPAMDQSGRPMRSTAQRNVRWVVPKE